MAAHHDDGYGGVCTLATGGTGPYLNVLPLVGYTPFSSMANGKVVACTARTLTGFECGFYTKSGGTTPQLARTSPHNQLDQTATPVNWPAGAVVTIVSSITAKDTASLIAENTWQQDQYYSGKAQRLSPDGLSFLRGVDNIYTELVHAGQPHLGLSRAGNGESVLSLFWANAGAGAGPFLTLFRDSSTPANADYGAVVFLSMRNSAGTQVVYGSISSQIKNVTAGAEQGRILFSVMRAGALAQVAEINDHYAQFFSGAIAGDNAVLIGKGAQSLNNVGVEIISDGRVYATASGAAPIIANRQGTISAGTTIVDVYTNNNYQGGFICDAAGVVSTAPFQGSHFSEWHPSVSEPLLWEELGTVVCTADGLLPGFGDRLPLVVPSTTAGDRRVYGAMIGRCVVGAAHSTNEPAPSDARYLSIAGVGAGVIKVVGPVEGGDFLETSDVPGAARSQLSEFRTTATVAKATQGSADDGSVRLVACTYEAG